MMEKPRYSSDFRRTPSLEGAPPMPASSTLPKRLPQSPGEALRVFGPGRGSVVDPVLIDVVADDRANGGISESREDAGEADLGRWNEVAPIRIFHNRARKPSPAGRFHASA